MDGIIRKLDTTEERTSDLIEQHTPSELKQREEKDGQAGK